MNRRKIIALLLIFVFLVSGLMIFIAPESSHMVTLETTITGDEVTTSSSEADFPFYILLATIPALMILGLLVSSQMKQGEEKRKPKNQLFDEDTRYVVGDDGELVELISPDVDDLFHRR